MEAKQTKESILYIADYSQIEQRIMEHCIMAAKKRTTKVKKTRKPRKIKAISVEGGSLTGRISKPIYERTSDGDWRVLFNPFDSTSECLKDPEQIAKRFKNRKLAIAEISRLHEVIDAIRKDHALSVERLKNSFNVASRDNLVDLNRQLLEILRFGAQEGAFPRRPQHS